MTPDPVALTASDTAHLLRAALAALRAEASAVPPAVLAWHPAAGEWCAKEVLGHLIEAERRGFAGRLRIILANDNPTFESWDQNEVSRARHDCERDCGALLTEFSALREESAVLVAGLAPNDLTRGGQHPKVGYLRIGDLLHEWVHHDRNHLRQMLANFQAYVWPHMGNTQRFSLP
jgi:DinB superfamily